MLSRGRFILSKCIPPIVVELITRFSMRSGYFGSYSTWDKARQYSTGYDSNVILELVRDSLLKVKNGEAVYERDSVLFDEIQYSWPLLAGLLWIASCNGNRLNLLDFGGALGSSYFQNKMFLGHLKELFWSVVEQDNFVECGKTHFENDQIKFYNDIDSCISEKSPNTALLCSVLPYVEKPYELVNDIINRNFTYIIVDRTPFLNSMMDRLTIQKVSPQIYNASYPAWFLSEPVFLGHLTAKYDKVAEFPAIGGRVTLSGLDAEEKGFIFRRRRDDA